MLGLVSLGGLTQLDAVRSRNICMRFEGSWSGRQRVATLPRFWGLRAGAGPVLIAKMSRGLVKVADSLVWQVWGAVQESASHPQVIGVGVFLVHSCVTSSRQGHKCWWVSEWRIPCRAQFTSCSPSPLSSVRTPPAQGTYQRTLNSVHFMF